MSEFKIFLLAIIGLAGAIVLIALVIYTVLQIDESEPIAGLIAIEALIGAVFFTVLYFIP